MAENKDKLGTPSDEMEDFDFDFDTDFSGDFFAEEPPPANTREAVTKSLKNAGKSFAEEFDVRDPDKITKYIDAAIPKSLSNEYQSLVSLKDSVLEELNTAGPEIKRNTNKLLKTINKYMPKGKMSGGIDKLINLTNSESTNNYINSKNKEAVLEESISAMINTLTANDERNSAEERIKQEIQYRKDLNQLEISNHIVANLDRLMNFNNTVTVNYYKQSLDLNYRLLDTAKEALILNKLSADTTKNQMEAIIRNTSLPDVVKVRSAEVVKMLAMQNMANGAMKSLFGEGTRLDRIKKRLTGVAKDKIAGLTFGLQSANMGIDMAESMKEQSAMMGGSGGLLGSIVGGSVRDFLGEKTGRYLEKNEKTANKIADIKEFFSDPRSWFKEKLDESYKNEKDPSFAERRKRDILSIMADVTNSSLKDGFISVERDNLDASAVYTNRTDNSVTKTIPRLLSEILFNTAGTNLTLQQYTGITPKVDKLRLDATTGKLITEKASLNKIKDRFEDEARSGGGAYNIRRATGTFLEGNKIKLSEKERAELDRAVSEYIMEGGKVTTDMFNDKKLLSKLKDKKLTKRVFRANESFKNDGSRLDRANKRTDFNNYIDRSLTSIKNPEQLFATIIKEGNIDQLEELGLISFTEDGRPVVNNKKYKELISKSFYNESLKYVANSDYKNMFDKRDELEKLKQAAAKQRNQKIKDGLVNTKESMKKKANDFRSGIKDGSIEEKIRESLSKDNIKNKVDIAKDVIVDNIVADKIKEVMKENKNLSPDAVKNKAIEEIEALKNSDLKKNYIDPISNKSSDKLSIAKKTTDNIINNIKQQAGMDKANDLIKSIITVDGNGTAVIERLEENIDKKKKKEETLEDKLDKLADTIDESNKLTKEEMKSTTIKYNDKNGDGVRDGSFREKMSKVFRTGPKKQEIPDAVKNKDDKDKSGGLFKTIMGAVFGGLSSLVGGLFSGLSGMFGGLTSLLGVVGKGVIGPLLGGIASMLPGFVKGGFKLAGKGIGLGVKGAAKFTKATSGTRGFERKLFGNLLGKIGGAAMRKLPLIGLLAGGYMGYEMIKNGDTIGGLGSMVSSLLAQIPGIGTALSLGVDGLLGMRDQQAEDKDRIDTELQRAQQELEERDAMRQEAMANNWEKEAIALQNKFDKYTAEQDAIKDKLSKLENDKFMTSSKQQLADKERKKLEDSEKALAEAKKAKDNLAKSSKNLEELKDKRNKLAETIGKGNLPEEVQSKLKVKLAEMDTEIAKMESNIKDMKQGIIEESKQANVVNTMSSAKDRLEQLEKARDNLKKRLSETDDPKLKASLTSALTMNQIAIDKVKAEIANPAMTENLNDNLNKENLNVVSDREKKDNEELYKNANGSMKDSSEIEYDRNKKLLQAKAAEFEAKKIAANQAYKNKYGSKSGYGSYTGSGNYSYSSGGGGGFSGGDINIADEATIARNSYKGGDVKNIIAEAAKKTGIDANLLQVMAAKESSLKPNAKAPTSSALGLYQFLDGTWKDVLNKYGNKYGLSLGSASRLNPEHSALMAGEYLKDNLKSLKGVKSNPNITDAYLTHFLGPGGARKFLSANPDDNAVTAVGKSAVNANPGIFIGNGRVRTVGEVYNVIASQLAKTAGDFGIKVTKDEIGGTSNSDIFTKAKNEITNDTTGPNTLNTPNRKSNEISNVSGLTGGLNTTGVPKNESPINPTTGISKEQLNQNVYDNGMGKLAKDQKDRVEQLNQAQQALDAKKNNYNYAQAQVDSVQPYNNMNNNNYKMQMSEMKNLSEAVNNSNTKLDSIVTNTANTVTALGKIYDLLAQQGAAVKTPTTNQSSGMTTKAPVNAIQVGRGQSINK